MKTHTLLLLFIFSIYSNAQHNDTQAALYNIGIGSFFGGVGALINKKPNENTKQIIFKGLYQGALGGAVVYGSKKMVYNFHKNENLNMLWSAKLVNAAGISIIENAAGNRDFWEKWHIHIGFNRIELETKEKLKIRYKIMPTALIGTIRAATKGKFNVKKSITTGTLVFLTKGDRKAQANTNTILIDQNRFSESVAHELIHTFQYDDYMTFNMFFYSINTKLKEKHKVVANLGKYLYMDYPGKLIFYQLYSIENRNINCYWDNFFEAEANFYSKKAPCHWWLQE